MSDSLHLWYGLSIDLGETDRPRAYQLLSAEERSRHDRLRFDGLRHDYLASHALLRTVLSKYLDLKPQAIPFVRDERGKPSLGPGDFAKSLSFNLSHTRGLAIVAVSPEGRAVGVDVEDLTRPIEVSAMRVYFADAERADLDAAPADRREGLLYSLWTLKEAYAKARGLGLKLPLTSFAFAVGEPGPICFTPPPDDPRGWRFHQEHVEDRYCLAAAVESSGGAPPEVVVRKTTPLG